MRKYKVILYIGILLILMTGCGKDKVEYVTETNTPTDSVGSDISMRPVAEKVGVDEELWEETVDLATAKKVKAEICVPDVTGMKVIEVETIDYAYDTALKEEFLTAISTGPIYYYGDEYRIKEEYEEDLARYGELLDLEAGTGSYLEQEYYYIYNELLDAYENAPDEYVEIADFSSNTYLVTSKENNLQYVVCFDEGHVDMRLLDTRVLVETNGEPITVYTHNNDDIQVSNIGENRCTMSQEDAQLMAEKFIEKLGVEEFELFITDEFLIQTFDTAFEEENYYDGYCFTFVRNIDGIITKNIAFGRTNTTSYQGQEITNEKQTSGITYYRGRGDYIMICVNDKGVVDFCYANAHKSVSMTENVSLLSYDSIKQAMAEEIYARDYYKFDCFIYMELTYLYYYDYDAKKGSIIPVWVLTNDEATDIKNSDLSQVIINAIDGSVINMGEQIYE